MSHTHNLHRATSGAPPAKSAFVTHTWVTYTAPDGRTLRGGESELAVASINLTDLENQLTRALTAAGHCSDAYREAPPAVRRQYNQGFFNKLYIDEDGTVQATDLNQPFAALLTGTTEAHASVEQANGTPRDTQTGTRSAGARRVSRPRLPRRRFAAKN